MVGRAGFAVVAVGLLAACATRGKPPAGPRVGPSKVEATPSSGKPAVTAQSAPKPDQRYDLAPIPVRITRPEYPAAAGAKGVHGRVVVEFVIDRSGRVSSARVVRSVPELDAAAVECVRSWQFKPALREGKAVETTAQAPVDF
jgi:TonB family protein